MTSFSDRELAWEAHEALMQREEFLECARRYKQLGQALAKMFGATGADTGYFMRVVTNACVLQVDDRLRCRIIAQNLGRKGFVLSPRDVLALLIGEEARAQSSEDRPDPTWLDSILRDLFCLGDSPGKTH